MVMYLDDITMPLPQRSPTFTTTFKLTKATTMLFHCTTMDLPCHIIYHGKHVCKMYSMVHHGSYLVAPSTLPSPLFVMHAVSNCPQLWPMLYKEIRAGNWLWPYFAFALRSCCRCTRSQLQCNCLLQHGTSTSYACSGCTVAHGHRGNKRPGAKRTHKHLTRCHAYTAIIAELYVQTQKAIQN